MARALGCLALILTPILAQTACWYPDGQTPSPADTPCNANASVSHCCNPDSYCLANGLCFGGGIISRGSCTDKSWSDVGCGLYCLQYSGSGSSLAPCDGGGVSGWTCDPGETTDCSERPLDEWDIVLRDDQLPPSGVSAPVDINPTGTVTPTTSTTSTAPTTVANNTSSSSSAAASSTDVSKDGSNTGAIAGGTIGGFVGGLLLGAAATWFWPQRKRKRRGHMEHEDCGMAETSQMYFSGSPKAVSPGGMRRSEPMELNSTADRAELSGGYSDQR